VSATGDASVHRRPRIAFIINSLTGGGAERSLVNLINFARDELAAFDVHLILLDREPERHQVNETVQKTILDARHGLMRSTIQLYRALKQLRPDVTISFLNRSNCANVIAARLLGFPCIISERVHTTSHFGRKRGFGKKLMVRLFYPLADAIVAVSHNVGRDLIENFGVSAGTISIIGNPISIELIEKSAESDPPFTLPDKFIVSAGRLVPNKNFPLMIQSYHRSGIGLPLIILGEGPARETLSTMANGLGLGNRVMLPGYVENPYPIIRRATFFASSSNAEGFPNALLEAMALGCPVIATDCEAGPAEILGRPTDCKTDTLVPAKYGILVRVNSIDDLAKAMLMMMDEGIRSEYARRSRARAVDFSPGSVVNRYMNLVSKCLHYCGKSIEQTER
jgi:glycosyltransferase involved in cell wall biosynthesis